MQRRIFLALASALTPLVLFGCAQLLGVDGDSLLREAGVGDADAVDASDDHSMRPGVDASMTDMLPREAGVDGCAPGTKSCNATCVPDDQVSYGCGDASTCSPCSLSEATAKCGEGVCAVRTCQPGFQDCDGDPTNGCESEVLSPATCGTCTRACPMDAPFCGLSGGAIGCLLDCPDASVPCGNSCIDTTSSATHCGGCNTVCPGKPNADPICTGSTCDIQCRAGFADCDNDKADGCEALNTYYLDGDGDGYGVTSMTVTGCIAPQGYAPLGGDCLDSNASVHPGQGTYFASGYSNAAGATSFDYDCDGTESEKFSYAKKNDCSTCSGSGYQPASPTRSGAGVDAYCGSASVLTCTGQATMDPPSSVRVKLENAPVPFTQGGSCSGAVAAAAAVLCK